MENLEIGVGPFGINGEASFDYHNSSAIEQISIVSGGAVGSIKFKYIQYETSLWSDKIGGEGPGSGIKTDKIVIDHPVEYLTKIEGHYKTHNFLPGTIRSLTFYTNRTKYGPYGTQDGDFFSIPTKGNEIVGFCGRSGWFLSAINVYLRPVHDVMPCTHRYSVTKCGENEEAPNIALDALLCKVGLSGGHAGRPWDDGVCSEIKQIIIKRGTEIHSIQTEYEKKGKSIWSAIHGGCGGEMIHRIKLDFPNEWLVCITGFYGEGADGEESEVLKSLTFYTNKGKYGPLGKGIGKFFTTAGPPGKVVGLMGSSGEYLNSIGVHVEYLN